MNDSHSIKNYTDIKNKGFPVNLLPENLQPYGILVRLDRPIGWWLLLLPGWWSIVLASGGWQGVDFQTLLLLVMFLIGAVVMRGAGCVMNDIWDRELDKKVERTRGRPIASGVISVRQALVFMAFLLGVGALILFSLNWNTILLGFAALPLIVVYPLMKRITYWPQLFLGITFNFGALMGWSAVTGSLSLAPLLLYAGGIFWTIAYDTIYAHQDKEDDLLAGVKSTALKFGSASKKIVSAFFVIALFLMGSGIILVSGANAVILLCIPALHMIWQLFSWKPDDQESSLKIFKSNRNFGLLVLFCTIF